MDCPHLKCGDIGTVLAIVDTVGSMVDNRLRGDTMVGIYVERLDEEFVMVSSGLSVTSDPPKSGCSAPEAMGEWRPHCPTCCRLLDGELIAASCNHVFHRACLPADE